MTEQKAHSPVREFLERFGDLMSRIILGVIYVILVAPVGLVLTYFRDPLRIKTWKGSSFESWTRTNSTLSQARKQG
ncbi:MAG: hypothetical protein H6834_17705 [Planctomycetes bacterium]|nr:hypothetical protein [Planctomycetota bacterium]